MMHFQLSTVLVPVLRQIEVGWMQKLLFQQHNTCNMGDPPDMVEIVAEADQIPDTGLRDQPVWIELILVPGAVVFAINEIQFAILPERFLNGLQARRSIGRMVPPGCIYVETLPHLLGFGAGIGWQCGLKLQERIIQCFAQSQIREWSGHIEEEESTNFSLSQPRQPCLVAIDK